MSVRALLRTVVVALSCASIGLGLAMAAPTAHGVVTPPTTWYANNGSQVTQTKTECQATNFDANAATENTDSDVYFRTIQGAMDARNADGIVIHVCAGTYVEIGWNDSLGLIELLDPNASRYDLTLEGDGPDLTILDGQGKRQIMDVIKDVTLKSLTVKDGYGSPGAVQAGSNVNVINTVFSGNSGTYGGAINAKRDVFVNSSKFINNTALRVEAQMTGGAILASTGEDIPNVVHIQDSTFINNRAGFGGAVAAPTPHSRIVAERSIFTENRATIDGGGSYGGAMFVQQGWVVMNNVTLYKNSADYGGAVAAGENVEAYFTTIAGNSTTNTESGQRALHLRGLNVTVGGVLFSGNKVGGASKNCAGTSTVPGAGEGGNVFFNVGGNFSDDDTCGFTPSGNNAAAGKTLNLGLATQPQNNGGAVWTMALTNTSPAVDAIACATAPFTSKVITKEQFVLTVDARNQKRPGGTMCDAGAFELAGGKPQPVVETAVESPTPTPTPAPADESSRGVSAKTGDDPLLPSGLLISLGILGLMASAGLGARQLELGRLLLVLIGALIVGVLVRVWDFTVSWLPTRD